MTTCRELPPAKRPRTEDAPPSLFDTKKHEKLWLDDGNIIIAAEDGVAFKVHKSILAMHSQVFSDMFSAPHTGTLDEAVEACPVIRVTDCSEHLAWLFTLLYGGGKDPFFNPNHLVEFRTLRAMLILAFKYDIEHLRTEALRRLRLRLPTTLADIDIRCNGDAPISAKIAHLEMIGVINLAHSYDLPELLPYAFLVLGKSANPAQLPLPVDCGSGQTEQLSADDLVRCLQGIKYFTEKITTMLQVFFAFEASTNCPDPGQCTSKIPRIMHTLNMHSRFSPRWIIAPLQIFLGSLLEHLCGHCRTELIAKHTEFRQSIWDSIGETFGIQPWPIPLGQPNEG